MKRGETWWTDFAEPQGSAPGFRRPVVIVQDDLLTDSLLHTVMVVPLTTNLQRGLAVGNVELSARETGLPRPSVALVCQVVTVDKSLFEQRVGSLSRRKLSEVDRGLRLALGLGIAPA
ncbi:MAG: type II toxin-antitoxin system PemK/MazF family toxin [Sandaracinaceae bacterium]|nr:type II toxin-antitoxin system PemK/MazF family toxin [Sandaracinaceae bacterium]MBK7778274.1 type II toxin-antitoxin system PemK/MazF family toxin [Sandaracinaceae bacterium]MBK8412237.1 type II toxin-antitoxin system PemK/MazF family toxin [Sandaracinaceae bacterium]